MITDTNNLFVNAIKKRLVVTHFNQNPYAVLVVVVLVVLVIHSMAAAEVILKVRAALRRLSFCWTQ